MSYHFFLGHTMLPVPPEELQIKINGRNKKINLINEGEVNLIKETGLTDISFKFLLPNHYYPFSNYDTSLKQSVISYALDKAVNKLGLKDIFTNPFSFKEARIFLDEIKRIKTDKTPFRFIVTRMNFDGKMLWNTNMLMTIENYSINENANNGTDIYVEIKLKEYVPFGTKELEVVKDKNGKEIFQVKKKRFEENTDYPSAIRITNQASVMEAVYSAAGNRVNWKSVARRSGVTNPLEKNIEGKMLKLE